MKLRIETLLKGIGQDDKNPAIAAFESDHTSVTEIFIRELIQNSIDARHHRDKPVKLKFKMIEHKDESFIKDIYKETLPLIKQGSSLRNAKRSDLVHKDNELYKTSLIIEEYNTIGLNGNFYTRLNNDPEAHYSNFMFGVNRQTKDEGGGSAGVGKIAMNLSSGLRSIVFLTHRSEDDEFWVSGKTAFDKAHTIGTTTFSDTGYLSLNDGSHNIDNLDSNDEDRILSPIKDKNYIKQIKSEFKFNRDIGQYGTSWAILAPIYQSNKNEAITKLDDAEQLIEMIIKEYFWAISDRYLEIDVNGTEINSETIWNHLESKFPDKKSTWDFFLGITTFNDGDLVRLKSDWRNSNNLNDCFIDDACKEDAFKKFDETDDVIGFEVPIPVKPLVGNKENVFIKFFIRKNHVSDENSEYLFRDYLNISGECNNLSSISGEPVDCCMLIRNRKLTTILRASEKADHTKFIQIRAEKAGYKKKDVKATIDSIRTAVRKIYKELIEIDTSDENILASIFGLMTKSSKIKSKKPSKKRTKRTRKTYKSPDRINISTKGNDLIITPGQSKFPSNKLPARFSLTIVEKTLSNPNPLNEGDVGFDNVIWSKKDKITGINPTRDTLTFDVTDNNFCLEGSGLNISRTCEIILRNIS